VEYAQSQKCQFFSASYAGIIQVRFKGYFLSLNGTPAIIVIF